MPSSSSSSSSRFLCCCFLSRFPVSFFWGRKSGDDGGEGISSKYKNISKGWGVQFPRHASFKKRSSVLLLLVSQKKKGKERKGKFGWIRSIFLHKIGGQNFIAISRVFSLSELEYIPKKATRARSVERRGVWNENKRDFETYYYYYDDDDKT